MTLNQLATLTEDELALALYVVNILSHPGIPKGEFTPRELTWFKKDALNHKLMEAVPKLAPEAHPIFISLMSKLGLAVEIKPIEPPCPPTQTADTGSQEPSPSINTESPTT